MSSILPAVATGLQDLACVRHRHETPPCLEPPALWPFAIDGARRLGSGRFTGSYALNMCFSVMTTSHRNRFLSLLLCICALSTAYYTLLCCDLFMGRVQRCDRSTVFQLCFNGVDLGKILWGWDGLQTQSFPLHSALSFCAWPNIFHFICMVFGGATWSGTCLRTLCSCICIRLFMAAWMLVGSYVVSLHYPHGP